HHRALRGWAFDGIVRARGGFPITLLDSDQAQGLNYANIFRPNLVFGEPLWVADPNQPGGRRLNPDAFVAVQDQQNLNRQGNLGRNPISGFGMSQVDLAVRREFKFGSERVFQIRAEAFNLLNHPNFADPVRYLSNPLFGQSPSMLNLMLGTGSPGSGLTPIMQTGGARAIQLVVRFRF